MPQILHSFELTWTYRLENVLHKVKTIDGLFKPVRVQKVCIVSYTKLRWKNLMCFMFLWIGFKCGSVFSGLEVFII